MTTDPSPSLILLDRDGVLNEDRPDYVRSADQWVWVPGAREALARLAAAGVRVGVVSNQACVGKGLVAAATLEAIHARMRREAEAAGGRIDAVFVCPHTDDADCDCRKPAPGLLRRAADHFGMDLAGVPFVGDARRDLDAAIAAGARPVLVRTGKGADTEAAGPPSEAAVYPDLPAFVADLLGEDRQGKETAC